jgi:hypothetical protein
MHSRGVGVALLVVSVLACGACGGKATTRGSQAALAVPPAPLAAPDGGPERSAAESDEAVRERILAALDAGDLAAADEPLRQLFGRSERLGTRSLLDAVDATTGRDAVRAHPFANVRPTRVTELPPEASAPTKPVALVARRVKGAVPLSRFGNRDGGGLGDQQYPAPPDRRWSKMPYGGPDAVPEEFAGNSLLLLRPSAGRWLALYGRDRADARFVAILREDGTAEQIFDFAAWRAKIQIAEAGISWAELRGTTLYVKNEVVAFDGFIAAIDVTTGKTLWRSEQVGFASNFVVGDDKVVIWRWQPRDSIVAIDRTTGVTAARLDTPFNPARVLVAAGGRRDLRHRRRDHRPAEAAGPIRQANGPHQARRRSPPVARRRGAPAKGVGASRRGRSARRARGDPRGPRARAGEFRGERALRGRRDRARQGARASRRAGGGDGPPGHPRGSGGPRADRPRRHASDGAAPRRARVPAP